MHGETKIDEKQRFRVSVLRRRARARGLPPSPRQPPTPSPPRRAFHFVILVFGFFFVAAAVSAEQHALFSLRCRGHWLRTSGPRTEGEAPLAWARRRTRGWRNGGGYSFRLYPAARTTWPPRSRTRRPSTRCLRCVVAFLFKFFFCFRKKIKHDRFDLVYESPASVSFDVRWEIITVPPA